jgi:flavodoxin I
MTTSAIGLFYGSNTGNTAHVAGLIAQAFATQGGWTVDVLNIAEYYLESMLDYESLILGVPTWNIGQLQEDWEAILPEFDELDLTGRQVAFFGLGDQAGYPDTFGDALFFVAEQVRKRGGQLVGAWPTTGYDFRQSWAVEDHHFLGLMIDEENQSELTARRVAVWVQQLIVEFGLEAQ